MLIVEDDPDIRGALADRFRSEGYAAAVASNGADAVNYLEDNERPCAVLVDLLMPGVVGMSLLDYMRADKRLASIPVAIISASPQLAPAGYRVFPKPFDMKALVAFVRHTEAAAGNVK
ncbi:MAG TPA: response regulator [Kofleriaceae bacterium]